MHIYVYIYIYARLIYSNSRGRCLWAYSLIVVRSPHVAKAGQGQGLVSSHSLPGRQAERERARVEAALPHPHASHLRRPDGQLGLQLASHLLLFTTMLVCTVMMRHTFTFHLPPCCLRLTHLLGPGVGRRVKWVQRAPLPPHAFGSSCNDIYMASTDVRTLGSHSVLRAVEVQPDPFESSPLWCEHLSARPSPPASPRMTVLCAVM